MSRFQSFVAPFGAKGSVRVDMASVVSIQHAPGTNNVTLRLDVGNSVLVQVPIGVGQEVDDAVAALINVWERARVRAGRHDLDLAR